MKNEILSIVYTKVFTASTRGRSPCSVVFGGDTPSVEQFTGQATIMSEEHKSII